MTTNTSSGNERTFEPKEIGLVGVYLNVDFPSDETAQKIMTGVLDHCPQNAHEGEVRVASETVKRVKLTTLDDASNPPQNTTLAIIYAYIYEGNCYRLARPQITTTFGPAQTYIDENLAAATGQNKTFYCWSVQRHQRLVTIQVDDGLAEDLILDANLPGNVNNPSFASKMQLGSYSSKMQSGSSFSSKMQSGYHRD